MENREISPNTSFLLNREEYFKQLRYLNLNYDYITWLKVAIEELYKYAPHFNPYIRNPKGLKAEELRQFRKDQQEREQKILTAFLRGLDYQIKEANENDVDDGKLETPHSFIIPPDLASIEIDEEIQIWFEDAALEHLEACVEGENEDDPLITPEQMLHIQRFAWIETAQVFRPQSA
jgi:hypothetical protein